MKNAEKIALVLCYAAVFTAIIFIIGLMSPKTPDGSKLTAEDVFAQYVIFTSQLLYGNMFYDVLKTLRTIPAGDQFWDTAKRVLLSLATLAIMVWGSAMVSRAAPFFPYVGIIVAILAYIVMFTWQLPKLSPAYRSAVNRTQDPTPNQDAGGTKAQRPGRSKRR